MPAPNPPSESFVEPAGNVYRGVHRVLSYGMAVSTVLYGLGVLRALQHPLRIPINHIPTLTAAEMFRGLIHLDPTALMLAATLLLILTPVVRVIVSFVAFWRDGDHRFAGVTAVVLAVIGLTVVLGYAGLH